MKQNGMGYGPGCGHVSPVGEYVTLMEAQLTHPERSWLGCSPLAHRVHERRSALMMLGQSTHSPAGL